MDDKGKVKDKKQKGLRSDNRVQVRLTIGRDENGVPIRKSFYGRTWTEACAKRDEYKARMEDGIVDDDITVSQWIDTYLSLYRKKVNDAYKNNDAVPYNRLRKVLGPKAVRDVREVDLQHALNAVDGMSYSTVTKYHRAITNLFERARKNRIIKDNPAEYLDIPNSKKGSHRALQRWESDCILQHWDKHLAGIWAMLMMLAGLRRGEMIALNWDNIDMDNRHLTVCEAAVIDVNQTSIEERAKTPAGIRTLPICAPLWDALNTIPAENRIGLVCTSANGKQLSESAFERGWDGFNLAMQRVMNGEDVDQRGRRKKLEDKIKDSEAQGRQYIIFNVKAHDLRHTFATALYDAGIGVKEAQYYLGHADIRMTLALYTHLSQEREKASRSQLVGFLDAWLDPAQKTAQIQTKIETKGSDRGSDSESDV